MSQLNQSKITVFYLPEELDDYNLDDDAFRLFVHISRVHAETGAGCSEPIKTMANKCHMSLDQASTALATLTSYHLISKGPQLVALPTYRPNPPSKWAAIGFIDTPI